MAFAKFILQCNHVVLYLSYYMYTHFICISCSICWSFVMWAVWSLYDIFYITLCI